MIHDLVTLEAYFEKYATPQYGIEQYKYGDTDDILEREAKKIRYPALWVELIDEEEDEREYPIFSIRITVQGKKSPNPATQHVQTLYELRAILRNVIKAMRLDAPAQFTITTKRPKFYYKDAFGTDLELLAFCEIDLKGVRICS